MSTRDSGFVYKSRWVKPGNQTIPLIRPNFKSTKGNLNRGVFTVYVSYRKLTLCQMTNFRLVQIENLGRRQNKGNSKFVDESLDKIAGKRENAAYEHYYFFYNVYKSHFS